MFKQLTRREFIEMTFGGCSPASRSRNGIDKPKGRPLEQKDIKAVLPTV
jgi:hypothetical protein